MTQMCVVCDIAFIPLEMVRVLIMDMLMLVISIPVRYWWRDKIPRLFIFSSPDVGFKILYWRQSEDDIQWVHSWLTKSDGFDKLV